MNASETSYVVPPTADTASETEAAGRPAAPSEPVGDQPVATAPEVSPQDPPAATTGKHTYGQILKSTALVGGSSAATVAIRIVRTKAIAVLLGPAGYGLFGLYQSVADLTQSIAGMGVNSSGVRQIAAAVGSGDNAKIAETTTVLRRVSIVLGVLGAILLLAFSGQISLLTFRTRANTAGVCLLSLAVLFQLVSWGQTALIQGLRRIADLAKLQVLGALFGTIFSVALVYFLREKGVVPALVCVALMSLVFSYWFSRRVGIRDVPMKVSQVARESAALLKLGLAFMASYFMSAGIAYAVRIILLRKVGMAATGYYQSAYALGGLYVGFILQAMAADFYPRLTASADDDSECNRLVNEQARVGLLVAGPGVIATLTFAPLVVALFYSAKFGAAVGVLRWICLGTTVQVITWPMGFINLAKAKQFLFFGTELAWTVASLVLAWVCISWWGLNGAGIAFFGACTLHGLVLYPIVNWVSGFRWSGVNIRMGIFFLSLITAVFCGFQVFPLIWAVSIGVLAALLGGVYSVRVLSTIMTWDQIPGSLQRFIIPLRPLLSRCAWVLRSFDAGKWFGRGQ